MLNIFSLFSPSGLSFKGQLPQEEVVLLKRRHWFFLALNIFVTFLFTFLPFVVYGLISRTSWFQVASDLFWFLTALYYLILWFLFFYNLTMYLLNIFILTKQRIVKREQLGFFNFKEATLELSKIQDISVLQKGILANLLNYGDLEIQTAGNQNKFLFQQLPNPTALKQAILNQ
ncbi:hypothetical protein COX24_00065 [bacterium (Candidatus Gribaldobacteria) CG23_combo_of_CG06-09_8_20_14_all_37_87_8]|uniref:YdbS-like PH domain-containing protein n=2 Tax=Candidatus Gribaldobacteria TaxID=2798536 RepID=A0A2G9ZHN8_9BACT|nr:MAG: hypothetical protein AUJ25_02760 [Parcubacteria group bacterium CG1_02_37_13]PIP32090.1 MAG: hypothetical protein COX24_00065 [bacterium (Candidatus Gribaldobacteria) CG23_combo_of_CG06-09_8_20_14_all_37_87_8]PIR90447.1 MAG: hypothetical protein COU05_01970 [bacterium (Candidatus Gribaldobacteria) CG10_big_fil_rev_8_21_14_0_10_37_21]